MTVLEPRLRHPDGWPVLSITEAPQTMDLTVTNRGATPIGATAGELCLLFRPGTLVDAGAVAVAPQSRPVWDLRHDTTPDGTLLTLRAQAPVRLDPGAATVVRIDGLVPDPWGGSRATRVEFGATGFTDDAGAPADGTRLMHLSVLRRRSPVGRWSGPGSSSSAGPFVAGFLGGRGVLNDGLTPNTLVLRVVNASGAPLPVGSEDSGVLRFTLGVRTGDALAPWGLLGSRFDHVALDLDDAAAGIWERDQHTVTRTGPGPWRPGEVLDLRLTVHTSAATGTAEVVLTYEDVPGHDDGELVLPVEVGPLAVADDAIRAIRPLHLRNDAALTFHRGLDPDTVATARIGLDGDRLSVDAPAGFTVNGESALNGAVRTPAVVVGQTDGTSPRLRVDADTELVRVDSEDGQLVINPNGESVGVAGRPAPASALTVHGRLDADLVRIGSTAMVLDVGRNAVTLSVRFTPTTWQLVAAHESSRSVTVVATGEIPAGGR